MLTREQVADGRAYLREVQCGNDTYDLEGWLIEHAEALIDAADRVARQEAYIARTQGVRDQSSPCKHCGQPMVNFDDCPNCNLCGASGEALDPSRPVVFGGSGC